MRSYLGSALFSASDLVNFTGCRHCTFLDLRDLLNGEDFKGAVTALTAIALSSLLEMKTLHRDDSPAIEYADGSKEWWIDGHELKAAAITALQRKLATGRTTAAQAPPRSRNSCGRRLCSVRRA